MRCLRSPGPGQLNKVDGVAATVNLSTERAHVTAPAHVPASDLVALVKAVGYSATMPLSSVFVVWNSLRLRSFSASR